MMEDKQETRLIHECTLTMRSNSKLHVHGSVMAYFSDDVIIVHKSDEAHPENLVIDLCITKGTSPMIAAPRPFNYIEQGEHVSNYKKVTVRYEDEACTIDVK